MSRKQSWLFKFNNGKVTDNLREKALKAFRKAGWIPVRKTGSHVIMIRENYAVTLSIPMHKAVKRGTLSGIIKDAGLSVEEFVRLL